MMYEGPSPIIQQPPGDERLPFRPVSVRIAMALILATGQAVLMANRPDLILHPLSCWLFLAALTFVLWLVLQVFFPVQGPKMPMRDYYREVGEQRSRSQLLLGGATGVVPALLTLWLVINGLELQVAAPFFTIFALTASPWLYALALKPDATAKALA